jgi:hypothetical protein
MKELVRHLDTRELPWEPLGGPGLFTRRLARDPASGERTALQRAVPELGQRPPGQAHFHGTYEEIIVVQGSMSFDGELWLQPGGYLYHPPRTVHGFRSALRGETWFLSRVGRDLDFSFVPDPPQASPYYVDGVAPARGWTYVDDPLARPWPPVTQAGAAFAGGAVLRLSAEPAGDEGSWLVRLPAGWRGVPGAFSGRAYLEVFVLEGDVSLADGVRLGTQGYTFRPGASDGEPLASDAGACLYVNVGARLGHA